MFYVLNNLNCINGNKGEKRCPCVVKIETLTPPLQSTRVVGSFRKTPSNLRLWHYIYNMDMSYWRHNAYTAVTVIVLSCRLCKC